MKSNVNESAAYSENAVVDVSDVKLVASDVKFSCETISRAANDDFTCVTHKTENCEICGSASVVNSSVRSQLTLEEQYEEIIHAAIAKREEYQCLVTQTDNSLYEVLSYCYQLALNNEMSDENSVLRKVLARFRKTQYDSKNKKVQKHSTNEHLIVRLVWAESNEFYNESDSLTRSKVSAYATVLKNAKEKSVTVDAFSSWLRNCGGVDAVRRMKHSEASQDNSVKIAESVKLADNSSVMNVLDDTLSQYFTTSDIDKYFVIVAKVVSTNEVKISGIVRKQSLVTAAMNAMRADRNAANKSAIKEQKEREKAEAKSAKDRKEQMRIEKRDEKSDAVIAAKTQHDARQQTLNALTI
jgi:hypothetical protein